MNKNANGTRNRTVLPRNQQQFLDAVADALQRRHPDWKFRPLGFGFDAVTNDHCPVRINLDNVFRMVSAKPGERAQLLAGFLQGLDQTVADQPKRTFPDISNKLFLALRSTSFLSDSTDDDMNAAFRLPVTPEIAVFWAIDLGDRIQHISKGCFRSWDTTLKEVTRIAYENTIKHESSIDVNIVGDKTMWIHSDSSFATVAHLMYWQPHLRQLIDKHVPALSLELTLVCAPTPADLIVTGIDDYPWIRFAYEKMAARGAKMLSPCIYELSGAELTARVLMKGPHRLDALPLRCFGFKRGRLPFVPNEQSPVPAVGS